MSNRERLMEQWRPVAATVRPDAELRRMRAADMAINPDGTVNEQAIGNILPWQRIDFHLPGTVVTGTSLGGIFDFPQGGQIVRINANARTAPATAPFIAVLTIGGTATENISIPVGETKNASGLDVAVPVGSIARINVTSAGGAEDVTVSCFYVPGGV